MSRMLCGEWLECCIAQMDIGIARPAVFKVTVITLSSPQLTNMSMLHTCLQEAGVSRRDLRATLHHQHAATVLTNPEACTRESFVQVYKCFIPGQCHVARPVYRCLCVCTPSCSFTQLMFPTCILWLFPDASCRPLCCQVLDRLKFFAVEDDELRELSLQVWTM